MRLFEKVIMKRNSGVTAQTNRLRRFSRSIPYFKTVLRAPSNSRWQMMQSMPPFVFNDFISVLEQIVLGRVNLGHEKHRLQKYQETLVDMAKAISLAAKKRILSKQFPSSIMAIKKNRSRKKEVHYGSLNRQNGNGFVLAALLPILALLGKAAATGAVGAATGYATKKIIDSV